MEDGFLVRYGDDREGIGIRFGEGGHVGSIAGQCGSDTFAEAVVLGVDIGGSGSGSGSRIVNWFGLDV